MTQVCTPGLVSEAAQYPVGLVLPDEVFPRKPSVTPTLTWEMVPSDIWVLLDHSRRRSPTLARSYAEVKAGKIQQEVQPSARDSKHT